MELVGRAVHGVGHLLDLDVGAVAGVLAVAVPRGGDDLEAADGELAAIAVHDLGETFEHGRGALVVGVDEHEVAPARPVDREVARGGSAAVLHMQGRETRVVFRHAVEDLARGVFWIHRQRR